MDVATFELLMLAVLAVSVCVILIQRRRSGAVAF